MKFNKSKIALGVATATLSLSAVADTDAQRIADATAKKTAALESQVQQMAAMMEAMQAELSRVKTASSSASSENSAKVQELDQWMSSVRSSSSSALSSGNNMVFFRGGYLSNDHSREGSILTDANALNEGTGGNIAGLGIQTTDLTGNRPNGDDEGWYFGAGFDLNLSNDLFGLMDGVDVLGEITFSYKEFSAHDINRAPLGTAANDSASGAAGDLLGTDSVPSNGVVCGEGGLTTGGAGPYGSCSANIAVTQITITASPKIKFMQGSKFRPWLIPAGFAIHVISPPSDGVTYIAPGIMFGGGADYNIWNNLYVGVDARYHLVSNTVADVELDGFEAGGYVGFGF